MWTGRTWKPRAPDRTGQQLAALRSTQDAQGLGSHILGTRGGHGRGWGHNSRAPGPAWVEEQAGGRPLPGVPGHSTSVAEAPARESSLLRSQQQGREGREGHTSLISGPTCSSCPRGGTRGPSGGCSPVWARRTPCSSRLGWRARLPRPPWAWRRARRPPAFSASAS